MHAEKSNTLPHDEKCGEVQNMGRRKAKSEYKTTNGIHLFESLIFIMFVQNFVLPYFFSSIFFN